MPASYLTLRTCAFVAVTLLVAAAAPRAQNAQDGPRRDPQLEALVAEARAAPPEFAADLLLRIAGLPKVADPTWRGELLDEAYITAYAAPEAYRRIAAPIPIDSRQSAQARAYDGALTRVSLQVRVAQQLAFTHPAHARELFEWIELNLEPGVCDGALAPLVDEYYTTLATLARTTYAADSSGRGDALRFFDLFMWRAHLPTEMPALARAILRFRPTRDEAAYLETTLRLILDTSLHDPRGFSTVSLDIVSRFMDLEDADRELGILGWNVTRALRSYMLTHLRGTRCADSRSDGPAIEAFNGALKRREIPSEVIPALAVNDTRPSRMLGSARIDLYWQTAEARRLYDAAVRLRGPGKNPLPVRDRRTDAWTSQAEHLLGDVEEWRGLRERMDVDYFYQKAVLYTVLLDLIPDGPLRVRTVKSFVEFVRRNDREREWRSIWFLFVNKLLELARGLDRAVVLDALDDVKHPVLSVYAKLERMQLPRRP